jgi:hypothetical protein
MSIKITYQHWQRNRRPNNNQANSLRNNNFQMKWKMFYFSLVSGIFSKNRNIHFLIKNSMHKKILYM